MFRRHPLLSTLTVVYLGIVGWVTLGPQPLDRQSNALLWRVLSVFSGHDSTSWITYSRVEFGSNILMFVPVGLFFLLLFGRRLWFMGVIAGIVLTKSEIDEKAKVVQAEIINHPQHDPQQEKLVLKEKESKCALM